MLSLFFFSKEAVSLDGKQCGVCGVCTENGACRADILAHRAGVRPSRAHGNAHKKSVSKGRQSAQSESSVSLYEGLR